MALCTAFRWTLSHHIPTPLHPLYPFPFHPIPSQPIPFHRIASHSPNPFHSIPSQPNPSHPIPTHAIPSHPTPSLEPRKSADLVETLALGRMRASGFLCGALLWIASATGCNSPPDALLSHPVAALAPLRLRARGSVAIWPDGCGLTAHNLELVPHFDEVFTWRGAMGEVKLGLPKDQLFP